MADTSEWLTPEEYAEKAKDFCICSYSPETGDHAGRVCGNFVVSVERLRCYDHQGDEYIKHLETWDPVRDASTGLNHYTYDGKRLNIHKTQAVKCPIEDQGIIISVGLHVSDFKQLSALCPNVDRLIIRPNMIVTIDARDFLGFKKLRYLRFQGSVKYDEEKNLICGYISYLAVLTKLNLKTLIVYDEMLEPYAPKFGWPKVRVARFKFIENISVFGSLISYTVNVKAMSQMEKYGFRFSQDHSTILVQWVKDTEHCTWTYYDPKLASPFVAHNLTFLDFELLFGHNPPTSMDQVITG